VIIFDSDWNPQNDLQVLSSLWLQCYVFFAGEAIFSYPFFFASWCDARRWVGHIGLGNKIPLTSIVLSLAKVLKRIYWSAQRKKWCRYQIASYIV
jgi:hypothetical protein